jgi:hypothetical protein
MLLGAVKKTVALIGVCGAGFPACHHGAGGNPQVGRLESLPHIQFSKMNHLFLDKFLFLLHGLAGRLELAIKPHS